MPPVYTHAGRCCSVPLFLKRCKEVSLEPSSSWPFFPQNWGLTGLFSQSDRALQFSLSDEGLSNETSALLRVQVGFLGFCPQNPVWLPLQGVLCSRRHRAGLCVEQGHRQLRNKDWVKRAGWPCVLTVRPCARDSPGAGDSALRPILCRLLGGAALVQGLGTGVAWQVPAGGSPSGTELGISYFLGGEFFHTSCRPSSFPFLDKHCGVWMFLSEVAQTSHVIISKWGATDVTCAM